MWVLEPCSLGLDPSFAIFLLCHLEQITTKLFCTLVSPLCGLAVRIKLVNSSKVF